MSYSGIDEHERYKKILVSPINRLPINLVSWTRDLLPEFLWIEYLRQAYNELVFLELYTEVTQCISSYADGSTNFLGFISDFGRISDDKKKEILIDHKELVVTAFAEPFGQILILYPKSPAAWLLPENWIAKQSFDKNASLSSLKATVEKLFQGKDPYSGYLRMIPLRRLFESGKIFLPKTLKIVELLPKYPHNLSDEDRSFCESFGRAIVTPIMQENLADRGWSKYFWRRNFELSPCENFENQDRFRLKPLDEELFREIYMICSINAEILNEYLAKIAKAYIIDLYSPEKDEIILGLFSRIVRLTSLILSNPLMWSYDLSRIMLRCLSDTTITFCYLIKKNDDKLFQGFIDYGKGKEKLLLLHLQDTHPEIDTASGESIDQLALNLGGGFSPAFVDINLGDWKDVSARDMANECNLMEIYRIIYDPTSSDIHGSWTSIKNANLTYCVNPLHRYHRIPQNSEPPVFLQPVKIAIELAGKAIQASYELLHFPKLEKPFVDLPQIDDKENS